MKKLTLILAEESWKNVKQTFSKSKHILLLKYHSIDKRGKFYTQNKGNAVEFTHLSEDVLINYIQQKLPALSEKNASKLIIWCNYDYGRILMEIDKIQQWVNYYTDKEGTPETKTNVYRRNVIQANPPPIAYCHSATATPRSILLPPIYAIP